MEKKNWIVLVDLCAFIVFLALTSTGTLMHFLMPKGQGYGRWYTVMGLTRHEWSEIHFYAAVAFLIILTTHLFLHLSFIRYIFTPEKDTVSMMRTYLALCSLILLGVLLFIPVFVAL